MENFAQVEAFCPKSQRNNIFLNTLESVIRRQSIGTCLKNVPNFLNGTKKQKKSCYEWENNSKIFRQFIFLWDFKAGSMMWLQGRRISSRYWTNACAHHSYSDKIFGNHRRAVFLSMVILRLEPMIEQI